MLPGSPRNFQKHRGFQVQGKPLRTINICNFLIKHLCTPISTGSSSSSTNTTSTSNNDDDDHHHNNNHHHHHNHQNHHNDTATPTTTTPTPSVLGGLVAGHSIPLVLEASASLSWHQEKWDLATKTGMLTNKQ